MRSANRIAYGMSCGRALQPIAILAMVACSSGSDEPRRVSWAHTDLERRIALGDTSALPSSLQRAFDPTGHHPMTEPHANWWLDLHDEPGQTFDAHRFGNFPAPDGKRRVIYIQPLGEMPVDLPPETLETLARVVRTYFSLDVRTLEALPLAAVTAKRRWSGTSVQLLGPEILSFLVPRLPDDAQAVIALTMADLYPREGAPFAFGQGSRTQRVAVASFARLDPAFYDTKRGPTWQKLVLARMAFTMIHEIGHTFGLPHCSYYECPFAGVNSTFELDRRPFHACPVCLRKLHRVLGFDPAAREDALAVIFAELDLDEEVAWSTRRAAWIRTGHP
jgi:archaemetzincin